jgi:hypothetical protein
MTLRFGAAFTLSYPSNATLPKIDSNLYHRYPVTNPIWANSQNTKSEVVVNKPNLNPKVIRHADKTLMHQLNQRHKAWGDVVTVGVNRGDLSYLSATTVQNMAQYHGKDYTARQWLKQLGVPVTAITRRITGLLVDAHNKAQ